MRSPFGNSLADTFDVDPIPVVMVNSPPPSPVATRETIDPETGEITTIADDSPPLSVAYDDRDLTIDSELDEIRTKALGLARTIETSIEYIEDPRAIPRLGEVAVTALSAALDSIKQKADIKKHKDKLAAGTLQQTVPGKVVNNTQNNTLVIDRNELLKQITAGVI
jgi:hypothetical protein